MKSFIRSLILLYLIGAGVYFAPPLHHAAGLGYQVVVDYFDRRPVQTVLILGNSRTFFNDMPMMVRDVADAANSPVRYAITTRMWPGAALEDHWNNADDRALLKQHWDHVIIQAESAAQIGEANQKSFHESGANLIAATQATHSPSAFVINWAYATQFYIQYGPGARAEHIALIESDYHNLAQQTGAHLIDTCRAWEAALNDAPRVQLYLDDNHPNVAGSYLSALMIYSFISGAKIAPDGYHPDSVDDTGAKAIRAAVRQFSNGSVS